MDLFFGSRTDIESCPRCDFGSDIGGRSAYELDGYGSSQSTRLPLGQYYDVRIGLVSLSPRLNFGVLTVQYTG